MTDLFNNVVKRTKVLARNSQVLESVSEEVQNEVMEINGKKVVVEVIVVHSVIRYITIREQ